MAIDRHVVGRVGEHHLRLLAVEQPSVRRPAVCIGAEHPVTADCQRSPSRVTAAVQDRRPGPRPSGSAARPPPRRSVDLGHLEAGDRQIELEVDPN